MTIEQLKKIKEKLEKYNLVSVIDNISDWFGKLNDKQIKNILSLNLYYGQLEKYSKLLINLAFLDSDNYLSDIKLLLIYEDKINDTNEIYKLLTDPNFINSKYHNEDLKSILSTKDEEARKYLIRLAISTISINSKYHREDMTKLSSKIFEHYNHNLVKKRYSLYENFVNYVIAFSKTNVDDKFYSYDGYKILESKTEEKSNIIQSVSLNKQSLESKYHVNDIEIIIKAKFDEIARYLGMLACDENSLKQDDHEENMVFVSSAKNTKQAYILYSLIKEKSELSNINYNFIMNTVLKCNDSFALQRVCDLIVDYGLKKITPYISLIINSSIDKFDMLCDLSIHSDVFSPDMIVKFNNIKYFPASRLYYNVLIKYMHDSNKLNDIYEKVRDLPDFGIHNVLSKYLNIDEQSKKEVKKQEDKLMNKEKLDLMYQSPLKYVDDNKCNELSGKVLV